MKQVNYEKDLRIDETALDVECLAQPRLTRLYGDTVAFHEKLLTKKREELDVYKAELTAKIHKNPDKYGIEKITVAVVESAILQDKDYQDLNNQVIEQAYELKMAQSAQRGIQDKKSMLELLIKLLALDYFAAPTMPRNLTNEWAKKSADKSANASIGAKLKRK